MVFFFPPNYNARTFRIMLNKNGENGHPCFVPSIGGEVSISVSILLSVMLVYVFLRSDLGRFPLFSVF